MLPNSCHPPETTKAIPYSLALRITRICSKPETREKRFLELKNMLIERNYKSSMIDSSIRRARAIPRDKALQKVANQTQSMRPIFCGHLGLKTAKPAQGAGEALQVNDSFISLPERGLP